MKKNSVVVTLILFAAIFFIGCSEDKPTNLPKIEKELFSMDTYITLTAYGSNAQVAVDLSATRIEEINNLLSTGLTSSEVYLINKNNGGVLTKDASFLLNKSLELYDITEGLFDISIYPIMELWGFTDKNFHVPSNENISDLLHLVNSNNILYDNETSEIFFEEPGMKIDFGAIAKGYTSSEIMRIFKEQGIEYGIVNLGGNVQSIGPKPDGSNWKIGIQNPDKTKDFLGVLETSDTAVISSGDYERFFIEDNVRYHHIIDPRTGTPARSGLHSVTIVCDDGTLADGLSTSLFIMGKEKATEFWRKHSDEFDMILFTEDEELFISEGLKTSFSSDLYDVNIIYK